MNSCSRPRSDIQGNDSVHENRMNILQPFEVSSISKNSKSGTESLQSKQILSMFNSLQCQLMTLQSTMVSLQMNQNAIQNTVEEVAKKVTKINSKVNSIQSNIRFEDKETGDKETESVIETEETDVDYCRRKEKKRRKKEKSFPEETVDKTLDEKSVVSSAKKSRNEKKPKTSDLNGQSFDYISLNVSEKVEHSNVNKINKQKKKSKSDLVSTESVNENLSVTQSKEEIKTSKQALVVQYEQKNKKKRKRSRKKKLLQRPATPVEVASSPPVPKEIHLNLPRDQRPNNVKVKFESDSEEESNSVATNSATAASSLITTSHSPAIIKSEPVTPKSVFSSTRWTPPADTNKNKRWMMRSMQVGNVLKHLRGETGTNGNHEEKDSEEPTGAVINGEKSSPVSFSCPADRNEPKKRNSVDTKTEKKSQEKTSEMETFEAIPISISEFSSFQDLHGPPRVGDRIAYKVIELSDTYSPEISAYKVADVISYDNQSGKVQLRLTEPAKVKEYPGKFDIPDAMETEESVLKSENLNIEMSYQELLEPKLIK